MTVSGECSGDDSIGSRAEAEGFVAMVCFKHGPPQLHGVELEWTVHHADDPRAPRRRSTAQGPGRACARHSGPRQPAGAARPGCSGHGGAGWPGGTLRPALASIPRLIDDTAADAAELISLLLDADLVPGDHGLDAYRAPAGS